MRDEYEGNRERFAGFAALYDRHRFRPPPPLGDILCRYAGTERPALVVDLGCATGVSTRYWADRAERVVGIDPAPDMLAYAVSSNRLPNVEYREGLGHATGLADACADVITCSQSFHWMEPVTTLAEIGRVLRPGGVFAAYHYRSRTVTGFAELEAALAEATERLIRIEREHDLKRDTRFYGKDEHLARMRDSGLFMHTQEFWLHAEHRTTAADMIAGFQTWAAYQVLRRKGVTDDELGVTALTETARRCLGEDEVPVTVSYVVCVGVTARDR